MAGFITYGDKDLQRFERDLHRFAAKAYPRVTQFTLNRAADAALEEAERNMREGMTLRNRWMLNSLRTEKTSAATAVRRQEALAGSINPAMEVQEFGGSRTAEGRVGIPRTTPRASGEGDQARPRTRVARPIASVRGIRLQSVPTSGSRKRRNAQRVGAAVRAGGKRRFAYVDLGKRKGIVRVTGGKRKPKVKLVQDMSERHVTIPANPWLMPAVARVKLRMAGIYKKKLKQELQRNRIFAR